MLKKSDIKERLDQIAAERLETIDLYEVKRAPIRRHWIPRALAGESTAGKIIGIAADIAVSFLPYPAQKVIGVTRKKTKEAIMPKQPKSFLKQKSTWEGISAIAGSIGLFISPEAAVQIIGGVFAIVGGIRLWMKESKDE